MDGAAATQSTPAQTERTNALRRILLAFVLGLASGVAVLIRHQTQLQPTPVEMISYTLAAGFVAMATAAVLQLSQALWSRGLLGSIIAILLFGLGSVAAISLICFVSVIAFLA
jgi:hypothetical protein